MKTKPKPRVMWARFIDKPFPSFYPTDQSVRDIPSDKCIRVAVIPLDDVDALVERAAKAIYVNARRWEGAEKCNLTWETTFQKVRDAYLIDALAALTAAGIPCKQRRARK